MQDNIDRLMNTDQDREVKGLTGFIGDMIRGSSARFLLTATPLPLSHIICLPFITAPHHHHPQLI